jgi:hypothetical protein
MRIARVVIFAALVMCALALSTSPAGAATFVVDSEADLADGNTGDGVCATATDPPVCTLRAGVEQANALAGDDAINLPSGKYTLGMGVLAVTQTLTINGAGAANTTVSGNDASQIFFPGISTILSLNDLTLTDGLAPSSGGAIQSNGELRLDGVVISGSSAPSAGGAIFSN